MRAKTLVQLPSELLCHTLSFLDAYDLVRVRKTCKSLKGIVDNSEMLQYTIDLGYFQMIPVGSSETGAPSATRRKQLRLYDAARQRVEYKVKYTIPSSISGSGHIYAFGGGIYGSVAENWIHFTRLPSASDSGICGWSHPVDVTTFLNFTFCAAQDLLVILTCSPDLRSHAYEIHLKSLTTHNTHPDAAQPFLKALDQDNIGHQILNSRSHVKLQIIGNYVCMLCRAVIRNGVNNLDSIQLWDWKSKNGYQFIIFFGCGISDYSFITEDRFLVFIISGVMEIYSIVDKSKPPQRTASILLPALADDFSYTDVFMSDNQNPTPSSNFPYSRKSHQQPSCSFHPSGDDQLIVILVWVDPTNKDRSLLDHSLFYRFVVRRSAILELESLVVRIHGQSRSNSSRLLWSTWGPQHTSWFQIQDNEDWHTSLNGFRTVESVNESSPDHLSDDPRRLYIRDFNPHIAWNYSAVDKSGWRSEIIPACEVHGMTSHPFLEPLGYALTYRKSFSKELFDVNEILSDESRILLIKNDDDDDDSQQIDILVF